MSFLMSFWGQHCSAINWISPACIREVWNSTWRRTAWNHSSQQVVLCSHVGFLWMRTGMEVYRGQVLSPETLESPGHLATLQPRKIPTALESSNGGLWILISASKPERNPGTLKLRRAPGPSQDWNHRAMDQKRSFQTLNLWNRFFFFFFSLFLFFFFSFFRALQLETPANLDHGILEPPKLRVAEMLGLDKKKILKDLSSLFFFILVIFSVFQLSTEDSEAATWSGAKMLRLLQL